MSPTWKSADSSLSLYKGDCLQVLPSMDAERFTAAITDPPYHLTSGKKGGTGAASLNVNSPAGRSRVGTGFMGKAWDGGDVALRPETWAEVYRVLKPGAHLLAFGGTRTFHRITCAIEDAGFEIRDCIMWVYGSGFPKSLDVSKAMDKAAGAEREIVGSRPYTCDDIRGNSSNGRGISGPANDGKPRLEIPITAPATDDAKLWQGYGTALKPAWEPIIVARKPLAGTVAENCTTHGCGALNIDGCRIEATGESLSGGDCNGSQNHTDGWDRPWRNDAEKVAAHSAKRQANVAKAESLGRWPANVIHDGSDEVLAGFPKSESVGARPAKRGAGTAGYHGWPTGTNDGTRIPFDSGSAARFFYCAKASRSDRGEGNTHPTVKPLALMSYLVKLVTMPGDGNEIIDPFAGSGTTLLACYNAFVPAVGIDLEADHVSIIERRAKGEENKSPLFKGVG